MSPAANSQQPTANRLLDRCPRCRRELIRDHGCLVHGEPPLPAEEQERLRAEVEVAARYGVTRETASRWLQMKLSRAASRRDPLSPPRWPEEDHLVGPWLRARLAAGLPVGVETLERELGVGYLTACDLMGRAWSEAG